MKKLFFLFVAFITTTTLWAYDFQSGDLYYEITSSSAPYTVEVTSKTSSYPYNDRVTFATATIPETVTHNGTTYSVTSIGDDAFYDCSFLTSITIPNSVTSIGSRAFYYCSSLTSMVVESGNSTYDSRDNCNAIIETATNTLIAGCQNTVIPNSVTSIGEGAFSGCSSLTSVTIGNSVTSIGNDAFSGCSSLTSITIPNSVTSIGDAAFYKCSSLTSITIPNSVTSIGEWAFCNCSSLTSITIPNSVTTVGRGMFYGCSKLKSVVLSNNITSLPSYYDVDLTYGFFENCSSLTSITIPNSVTSIGWGAFSGCSSLVSMVVESGNTKYDSRDNCNAIIETATNILIAGCQNTTIPNIVTSIGNSAFRGCSFTSITIPNSVTSIGNSAFGGCSSLKSITIPNSVTSIGNNAFSGCSSLASLTIPNSVTSIGNYAFGGCSSLKSITIPNSVTSIGNYAFYRCSSLTSVTIPNNVTSIGFWAFYDCSSLTSITCEAETPPTVGSSAFEGVSQSIPVYVPCGCVEAYKTANGWKNFTNIQEALAKYSIEVDVNDNIMGTATVDINSMCGAHISATANIGHHFVQWSDGNTDNPRTLTLTQDTVLTAEFALTIAGQCGANLYWSYNESDQTISITGSGKMYDYTADTQPWFLFEEQIMEVITSNTATSIGTSAFEGCLRLGKVSLGAAMENVAANAFAGCTRLYHIYCYPTYPPFADESSFANYNVNLYVPCNYLDNYKYDRVFGSFRYIQCIDSEDVTTDDVVVTPGTNDVTITWPTEGNADTYTIVIKKGDEVFCTLTFNAEGQLLNIAFAPGRNGNHPMQYAEQVTNGYRFTVTGLEESTHYAYNIDVRDIADKTINSHAGEFTTQSITAVDNIQSSATTCQKIMHNGQLIILRDGKEYNAMGKEIQ